MGCGGVDRAYIAQSMVTCFNVYRRFVGDDGIAIAILSIATIGLVLLLGWSQRTLIPKIAAFTNKQLIQRAQLVFNSTNYRFYGFRFQTVLISVLVGSIFVLAKPTSRFPGYWLYTVPFLVFFLACVPIIAFSKHVKGNVPKNQRRAYLLRFYIPTFTALALVFVNVVFDSVIAISIIVATLLDAI
jgi:hypothetical protein